MMPLGRKPRWIVCALLAMTLVGGCKKDKGPRCGDGVVEGNEVCDGTDLAGETCESFTGEPDGVLRCAPDCQSFEDGACH